MIKNYLSLIKFSHTIFALPFALIGFFTGVREISNFSWTTFLYVILCMVFARSAAMAFNRYIDRKIDTLNPRTAIREIPSNIIKPKQALFFVIINCLLFIITTYFINDICFYLSPVALTVILGYSYTKRFTFLCHIILGIGLSLAPIGAYLAVTGYFSLLPILYSGLVVTWVSGFDVIYALQDSEFDKQNKLWSIPSFFGKKRALTISILLHVLSFVFLLLAAFYGNYNYFFWIGVIIFTVLLIRQHTLVKVNDLTKINLAFFTMNGLASILLFTFFMMDMYCS